MSQVSEDWKAWRSFDFGPRSWRLLGTRSIVLPMPIRVHKSLWKTEHLIAIHNIAKGTFNSVLVVRRRCISHWHCVLSGPRQSSVRNFCYGKHIVEVRSKFYRYILRRAGQDSRVCVYKIFTQHPTLRSRAGRYLNTGTIWHIVDVLVRTAISRRHADCPRIKPHWWLFSYHNLGILLSRNPTK